MLASKACGKGLELALDMPPELSGMLRGDPHRVQQIVVNLLGNAIKFTEAAGQVQVHVSVVSEDEQQICRASCRQRILESVSPPSGSTGCFVRLQVHASTTRQFGGTGLGLAISNNLSS